MLFIQHDILPGAQPRVTSFLPVVTQYNTAQLQDLAVQQGHTRFKSMAPSCTKEGSLGRLIIVMPGWSSNSIIRRSFTSFDFEAMLSFCSLTRTDTLQASVICGLRLRI
jgi:hypothetical protein